MKIALITLGLLSSASAFSVLPSFAAVRQHRHDALCSTVVDIGGDLPTATASARKTVMDTATRLKKEYGTLLVEKKAKDELKQVVEDLESLSEPPGVNSYKETFLGDWTLICTTATSQEGVDTSKIPFLDLEPIRKIRNQIRDNANKYVKVEQCIRSTKDDGVIDRVDHVLEYDPPTKLKELVENLPEQLTSFNINPLEVRSSKLILIHKAKIVTEEPLVTQLALNSIVLNVAGTSTMLDPNGKDVAGINLPFGEFVNTGDFETTYMDDNLRISRGKQGLVDQLRVFIRTTKVEKDAALEEIIEKQDVGKGVDADMDVDEAQDPEFSSAKSEEKEEVTDDIGGKDEKYEAPKSDNEEANEI